MKVTQAWLNDWVKTNNSLDKLCVQLTDAGLEVDFTEPAAAQFSGITVAKIISAIPHPNADKLQVCQVSDGTQTLQVVCGAPNAREGLIVAFATIGAVLPGNFKIKKAKLRGTESNGMLCGASEIGLAETANGLIELPSDAPLGVDLREYMQLDDTIIDIDLTPNRGDCLSIKGVARELGVINEVAMNMPEIKPVPAIIADKLAIDIQAPSDCPRYCSRVIKNIDVSAPTPLWMQEKLRRCGMRSICPVVDVTNYIVLELGQPMHAFALNKIVGGITVRFAKADETLILLDDTEVKLDSKTLVIADSEKPLAIAGVMGGAQSGVTGQSVDVVLESAFFNPLTIMGTPRRYGVHTDSSQRFERGVDPSITLEAMEHATQLILSICGGEPGEIVVQEHSEHLPQPKKLTLRRARIPKLLGFEISDAQVVDILQRLGMDVTSISTGWEIITPLHRFDMAIEEDLIEEIARIYGYEHIPSVMPKGMLNMLPATELRAPTNYLRDVLVDLGYHETLTYSFVNPKIQGLLLPNAKAISLQNPLASQLSEMRISLWPNLVQAVVNNQKHQQDRIRLFEVGRTFAGHAPEQQPLEIAGIVNGSRNPEQWSEETAKVDFFDVKANIEALIPKAQFIGAEHPALHPGQSAQVMLEGKAVGWLGTLHPRVSQKLKIAGAVVLFSLELDKVSQKIVPQYQQVSKYPQIQRDLAFLTQERVTFGQVYDIVGNSAGELLTKLDVFDIYRGSGVEEGYKSLAVRLTLQHPERTLVDEEVATLTNNVIEALKEGVGAELRE
jgi:phenylalanyl-tRNA synthetase beta chain